MIPTGAERGDTRLRRAAATRMTTATATATAGDLVITLAVARRPLSTPETWQTTSGTGANRFGTTLAQHHNSYTRVLRVHETLVSRLE
jgi:hypothetical protein